MKLSGVLSKMHVHHSDPVRYELKLKDDFFNLNSHLGRPLQLTFTGAIFCSSCGKKTKKSYSQGHCFPCSMKLAECDFCILKPETCHYDKGTCREPAWGEEHCLKPHVVYLANSSGLKIGITRQTQVPIRWIDQGAIQALPILEVKNRLTSGLIEVIFKKHVADKTDWRKMLKGHNEPLDLFALKKSLMELVQSQLSSHEYKILDEKEYFFHYPVLEYPQKINSLSFDKTSEIHSKLQGIKGQYLLFEDGVFNVRAHSGYEIILNDEPTP